ncbi:MAG: hypothetical protein ACK5MK_03650 [Dysgonomonas sp.]
MKNNLSRKLIIFTLILGTAALMVQCKKDTAVQKFMEVMVDEQNKKCPQQIDVLTRLENMEVLPNKTLKINLTTSGINSKSLDASYFEKESKPILIYDLQNQPFFAGIKEFGITVIYSYKDKDGQKVTEITITPQDYDQPMAKPGIVTIELKTDEEAVAQMDKIVEETKPHIPMILDGGVQLMEVKTLPGLIMQYSYICTQGSPVANLSDTTAFVDSRKKIMVSALKGQELFVSLLKYGATLKYLYNDADNKYLFQINITSKDL